MIEKQGSAFVHEAFRMPLDSDNGQGGVHDSLDYRITGTADGKQRRAEGIDSLMMGGVDKRAAAIELIEEIRPL